MDDIHPSVFAVCVGTVITGGPHFRVAFATVFGVMLCLLFGPGCLRRWRLTWMTGVIEKTRVWGSGFRVQGLGLRRRLLRSALCLVPIQFRI